MVVAQEIFGVNSHIRNVCDRLAAEGYVAVAPALFDRFVRDFQSGYSPDEVAHARSYLAQDRLAEDAARYPGRHRRGEIGRSGRRDRLLHGRQRRFPVGDAALRAVKAAVGYYGGQIVKFADEKPKCPVQMHFGETDASIPMADVEIVKQKRPDCEIYAYPAGHGFYCDERASFQPGQRQARLAAHARVS